MLGVYRVGMGVVQDLEVQGLLRRRCFIHRMGSMRIVWGI